MQPTFDVVVIGAGMAGASIAAFLSGHRRVALVEAEEAAGYHTTGRSAALWTANYGPPDVRLLTRLSRPFFETPPDGFATVPLLRKRPVLFLAEPQQMADLEQVLAAGSGVRNVTVAEAKTMLPALRDGYAAGAAGLKTMRSIWTSPRSIKGFYGSSAAGTVCWRYATVPDTSIARTAHGGSRPPPVRCSRPGPSSTPPEPGAMRLL